MSCIYKVSTNQESTPEENKERQVVPHTTFTSTLLSYASSLVSLFTAPPTYLWLACLLVPMLMSTRALYDDGGIQRLQALGEQCGAFQPIMTALETLSAQLEAELIFDNEHCPLTVSDNSTPSSPNRNDNDQKHENILRSKRGNTATYLKLYPIGK